MKNQLHCITSYALKMIIECDKDSKLFQSVRINFKKSKICKDKILLNLLYTCSQESYLYPKCRVNDRIDARIAKTEDEEEIKRLKRRKIKAANSGFLREIGNMVDSIEDKDKKSMVTLGKVIKA